MISKPTLLRVVFASGFVGLLAVAAFSQGPPRDPAALLASFRERSVAAEKQGLAEPFKGITAKGEVEKGLFAIKSPGVSTEPVRKAADAFLAALTPDQRKLTTFGVDDDEWRK